MRDLSLHILDIAWNAVEAGATRIVISIDEAPSKDRLTISIADNGKGMTTETLRAVRATLSCADPGVSSHGLPRFAQASRQADGDLRVISAWGLGTIVTATMRRSHPRRKPLGALDETLSALITGAATVDFVYRHSSPRGTYTLDTGRLRAQLDDIPLHHFGVSSLIRGDVTAGLRDVSTEFQAME